MKTPGKTETSENGDLSADFENRDFENGVFPCVNTLKRKLRAFSAGSHMVSMNKMAVLTAFHVDPMIVTHASLVNFRWIQSSLHMLPSLSSHFGSRVDVRKRYLTKMKCLCFRITALSCKRRRRVDNFLIP